LARLTVKRDWHVRFIELMPLGGGECAQVARTQRVANQLTRRRIEDALGALTPLPGQNPADESENFRLPGGKGVVGLISPLTRPYCGTCNRMRLTSDGKFHLCLLHDDELDVRAALRSGAGEEKIGAILVRAVTAKPTGHQLQSGISTEDRNMYQIGG
jgi:cyclic pyranopterin phosphate synthase